MLPKLSKKIAACNESQTLALTALAQKLQSEGHDVVSLTAGEPDFPTPTHIKFAAIDAINSNKTKYTLNSGIIPLRKAIAEKLKKITGWIGAKKIFWFPSGAKQSFFNVLQAICNPKDEVIIPAPFWVSYPEMVKLVDAKPIILNTNQKNDFAINPAELRKSITKKTKAIILCSPSNPTGVVYNKKVIEQIVKIIEKTNIFVISDEIYEKIIYDGAKHVSIGQYDSIRNRVITINGVSKAFSMTGWRLGYAAGCLEVIKAAGTVQSQVTSNASSISQYAALEAISKESPDVEIMRKEFEKRRNYIFKQLTSIPNITSAKPQGAFYLFPNVGKYLNKKYKGVTIKTVDNLVKYFIEEEKVVMVPGSAFGSPNHIRLSYACSMDNLEKACARLKRGFEKLSKG